MIVYQLCHCSFRSSFKKLPAHGNKRERSPPGAVQLDQKDPLPLSKVRFEIKNVQRLRCGKEKSFAVRMSVPVLMLCHVHGTNSKIIMTIVDILRRNPFQHLLHVLKKQRFVFVHHDSGRRMPALEVERAILDFSGIHKIHNGL